MLVALGNPPADEVSSSVLRHYLDALIDAGAHRVGVVAESTELRTADHVVAAMHDLGLELAGVHGINGLQKRSMRDLIELRSRNPFLAQAPEEIVNTARAHTLAWAANQYGDLDSPRRIPVRRVLHEFRHFSRRATEAR